MSPPHVATIDGNEAVARVAYKLNEVIALYPITPATPMGEWADAWAAAGERNLWGTVPSIIEMQSEGGAAGAIHGALQTGALATTFTASQGLLLMLPNMFKIAGELTPLVLHVAARSLAAQALSIFGDHSDVMAARGTGFALLCAASVQEAQDFCLIAHAATLDSRIPFLFFFDGFRTSHEIAKIELLPDEVIRAMIDERLVAEHRARALSPDHPVLRGTAQNPDVYFQARETVNPFYAACPQIVQRTMDRFAALTGRQYRLFEYDGAPDAERVIVLMGSGCEAAHETVDWLVERGEKVGVLKVRLYRPLDVQAFAEALPRTVRALAVLDRTKEPGSAGEPLYLDCVNALYESGRSEVRIIGGRYGLSSKEFTPAMLKAVFGNLAQPSPRSHFTIGIHDDVSGTSLDFDPSFSVEPPDVFRALFYGLGSDGTVGANKETIKIIGENTAQFAQAYFVYDSKKAGAMTISHLRFGPRPIRSTYLISEAQLKAINMRPQPPLRESERENWNFFLALPEMDRRRVSLDTVREMQPLTPLFEFSGACAGCGETPYIRLLTQLFGDRLLIANATGCSSIYGGNLPTTPYTTNAAGRGPAWSNSLFEDAAEFGLGFRVSLDKQREFAAELLQQLAPQLGDDLAAQILAASQRDEADIFDQRERVAELKHRLDHIDSEDAQRLLAIAATLVRKSVWIVGGDGWGYDIGYGGLDHVLASGRNVKVLLLDTEVYSNTGGQCSKATPRGAVAKFAAGGKPSPKKDLGLIAMTYRNIYVASVAMGAKDEHTLKSFIEAEAYDGPALIIAYSHCIAHGIDMTRGMQQQKAAVQSGQWILYRYNPSRAKAGENPLHLDSAPPKLRVAEYLNSENRFKMLTKSDPAAAQQLFAQAQDDVNARWQLYQYLAAREIKPQEAKS